MRTVINMFERAAFILMTNQNPPAKQNSPPNIAEYVFPIQKNED